MNNKDVVTAAWDAARRSFKSSTQSIHQICGSSIELILKASVASRTLDNITGVLIAFKNFRKTLKNELSGIDNSLALKNLGDSAY